MGSSIIVMLMRFIKMKRRDLKMINLLSAVTLSVIGSTLISRHTNSKGKFDFIMTMAIWSLILSGMSLAKFFEG
jgi:multisubunit Na+/H+ antiporter MnhF subunit